MNFSFIWYRIYKWHEGHYNCDLYICLYLEVNCVGEQEDCNGRFINA